MCDYRQPCPSCDLMIKPYETEDYTGYVGYPAIHGCYAHCGAAWTYLHEPARLPEEGQLLP